jgi:hypothetical protein
MLDNFCEGMCCACKCRKQLQGCQYFIKLALFLYMCIVCVIKYLIICLNLQIHSCVFLLCTHAFTVKVQRGEW